MADQSREGALRSLLDYTGYGPPPLRTVVRRALESGDVALCRTLVLTPLSRIDRAEVVAILDRLHAADALDAQVVQHAYTVDVHLGYDIVGVSLSGGSAQPRAACFEAIRPHLDELVWRLTDPTSPASWDDVPRLPAPRGLRFVLRALDWTGDQWTRRHLGAPELSAAELEQLVAELRQRPVEDRQRAFRMRRPIGGGLTAALRCEFHGYFGMGDVVIGELRFFHGTDDASPLADVPPVAFSEVMRDLDLAVSVAGTDPHRHDSQPRTQTRAQILAALIADIGLRRVTIDGNCAIVRGHRATHRVHLNSGSIHVEPGGYLCVVPAGFGQSRHRKLFLPFADEDHMTSNILSKVLLKFPRLAGQEWFGVSLIGVQGCGRRRSCRATTLAILEERTGAADLANGRPRNASRYVQQTQRRT